MADPYVRAIGHLPDADDILVVVGVDYDTVTIGGQNGAWARFGRGGLQQLSAFLLAALTEADENGRQQRLEAADQGEPWDGT